MLETPEHITWLVDTGKSLTTVDGKTVDVWEFRHEDNNAIMSAWAKHFRNHYCPDGDIDFLRGKKSRKDYLNELKFPSSSPGLGPSVRSGDFGEILVADYLQWRLGYWVPRVRWASKANPNESTKGSDVVGFLFARENEASEDDILTICEVKAGLSSNAGKDKLQIAVNDSAKDHFRMGVSLNFIKQKLYEQREIEDALKVARFQTPIDVPYETAYQAVALLTNSRFDTEVITNTEAHSHPNSDQLLLLVIRGKDMMKLAHSLYKRAADEA
jgi:hypothetical protein